MITNFKIFENEIDRTDNTINYKKGDYIFFDNEVQKIYEVGLVGWISSPPDKKGIKVIRFRVYDKYDKGTSITLDESEIILPTDEQINDFKNEIAAKKLSKKYNL
jgi:hypothetical protein